MDAFKEIIPIFKENPNPFLWTLFTPDALLATCRIRHYVLDKEPKEAWKLKESYRDVFGMLAFSAAIIAQIGILVLALPNFGTIHWTATAFAYGSLIGGLLATFFSFYIHRVLSDLHSPEDVREWLTSPRLSIFNLKYIAKLRRNRRQRTVGEPTNMVERVPSIAAAATLTAPGRLLTSSVIMLFLALGIYLGSTYTADMGTLKGQNPNFAVLLFFIIFATTSISHVVIPLLIKQVEKFIQTRRGLMKSYNYRKKHQPESKILRDDEANLGATTQTASSINAPEIGVVFREALQASIRAQEESLKAQKVLLQFLTSQVSGIPSKAI